MYTALFRPQRAAERNDQEELMVAEGAHRLWCRVRDKWKEVYNNERVYGMLVAFSIASKFYLDDWEDDGYAISPAAEIMMMRWLDYNLLPILIWET